MIIKKNKNRTFISVNLSDDERESLNIRINKFNILDFAKSKTKIRVINTNNYHLTIAFLGSVLDSKLDILKKELGFIVNNFKPFECKITGLGAFPDLKSARLIFLKIESPELQELAKQIRKVVIRNGFKLDHDFKPHITIVRFKDLIELNNLDEINAIFKVDAFFLMQSVLTAAGPVYSKLEKFGI